MNVDDDTPGAAHAPAKGASKRPAKPKPKEGAAALFDVYKAGLRVSYDTAYVDTNGAAKTDAKIEALLDAKDDAWVHLYEAEQRIAAGLAEINIEAEAVRRFAEATALNVPTAPALKAAFEATSASAAKKKAAYCALLDDLHFRYEKRRLDRRELERATLRINWIGIGLLALIVTATVNLLFGRNLEEAVRYHQMWVVYFGLLGAYFSRLMNFAASAASLDYDVLAAEFSWWAICRRLIAGAVGAMLLYCLVRGNILSGDLFPHSDFSALMTSVTLYAQGSDAITMPLPNVDFSKLLVWSTIAGFSERLIPDQFARLEASSSQQPAARPS